MNRAPHEPAEPPIDAPPWLFRALLAAVLALVAWRFYSVLSWAWPIGIDDAFISFRYARNLAEGHGLTWNVGEAPVEGYSNFLWVVLLAAVHRLGLDPFLSAKVLGLGAAVAGLGAVGVLTWRVTGCRFSALAAVLMLGFSQDYVVSAILGLETTLYLLLAMAALATVLRLEVEPTPRLAVAAGLLLGLAALTRPEGPMLFLVSAGYLGVRWRGNLPRRVAVIFAGAFAALVVPYLAFRLAYYGDYLPNAVRAKDAGHEFVRHYLADFPFFGGPQYVGDLLRTYAPCLFLGVATVITVSRAVLGRLALLGVVAAGYVVGIWRTWPVMGVAHRLLLPVAAVLIVLAAPAVVALARRLRTPLIAGLALVAAVVGLRFFSAEELPPYADDQHSSGRPLLERYWAQLMNQHRHLATELAKYPDITIAIADCGIVPYYSRQKTIDLFGLSDRRIATGGPSVDYVLDRKPELVILMTRATDHYVGTYDWEKDFWTSKRFADTYVKHQVWQGFPYHLVLFRRADWTPPGAQRPAPSPEPAAPE